MATDFVQDEIQRITQGSPENQTSWEQVKQSGLEAIRMLNPVRTDAPKVGSLRNTSSAQVKRGASLLPTYAATVTGATGSSDPTDYLNAKIMRSGRELVIPSNQTTAIDRSAKTGLRTFTQGTPGQDGYARMVVTPAQQGLRTAGTVQTPGGMTFSGTAADAQKFMEPVGRVDYNSPQYQDFVAYNRSKTAAPQELTQSVSSVAPAPPVFGGTGGWKTDIAKYQADMQAYNAAINEQGALARESLRAISGQQQPAPESQSQIALRNMQTQEAQARTNLYNEQTKQAQEQQKWTKLTEEVPTLDPETKTMVMKKREYLYNAATNEVRKPNEQVNPLEQDAAAKRAAFAAANITDPAHKKKWDSMTPEQQDAAMAIITSSSTKK